MPKLQAIGSGCSSKRQTSTVRQPPSRSQGPIHFQFKRAGIQGKVPTTNMKNRTAPASGTLAATAQSSTATKP